jgi:hypothetical protein
MAIDGRRERLFTPEEYLELERKAPEKSEFYDGRIYGMSGSTAIGPALMLACRDGYNSRTTTRTARL